ncbi:MAG: hypothetical protein Q8880_09590, partial [Bacteroidota bacterium]|nr:hypothetical protein [Bacteroidota bacterium]
LDVNYIADNTQTPPLGLTVNGLPVTVFLNYGYWNISPNSGVSALNYNLTLTARGQTNGGGAKEDYTIISNIGSGWANVGTHNNSTQSFSGSDIIAVRNAMNTLGSFIFGKMYNVSYNQPVITNTLSITGADVRVMNAGQLTVIGSNSGINNYQSALLQIDQGGSVNLDGNVTNNTNSSIQIDGNLNLKGNWYNNAISSLALTTTPAQRGTVTFQGASGSQAIGGISTTYFENLTLNNSSGLSMVSNVRVDSLMTFTNGIINTGVDTLILTCKRTDIFSGTFSATKYINGTLKKYVTNGATPYDLPIGTASNYEYAKVWINTQTGLSYITVNFNVDNSQTPPVGLMAGGTLPITSFMNYGYWTVKPNVSISAVNYDIQVQSSGQSNGGGVPSEYALVPDLGAGWVDAGGYLAGNQSFNGSNIIAKRTALTSFGSYIVGRNATPVIYPVTNNVRNKGAVIKIQNGKTFNIQGQGADLNNSNVAFTVTADAASAININGNLNNSDNSEFRTLGNATINENVNNNSSALITVDGTLNINGNWINNAIANSGFSCTSAKGTVVFGRTDSVQTIDGSVITQFENLTVNNVNGVRLLIDEEVGSILTFTTGKIYTGSNKLVLKSTGTDVITGNNTSNYVYGNLRKYVSTGSYILPIGDSLNYELATLEVVNASNLNYVDVNFTKSVQTPPAGLTVQNIPITQFLNYGYWTISGNAGCNNFKYNITLQSIGQTNGGGLPELYAVIPDTFTGNWIDYGSHVVSTQVVTVNSVTAKRSYLSQFGRFEIGKATSAIYNQIAITNQLKNKGAVLRIGNNKTVNLQGGFAELDNVNSGILKSYGTVNVYKNILNDYGGLVYNYGTIYTQSNYINSHGSDIMNFGTLNIDSNITNEFHSIVRIDGTINIKGNWINNGIQKLALNDASTLGTVSFIGSSTQYIKGTAKTEFENLTINNPQNVVLSNDQVVDSLLTFNSGIIKTGSYKLTLVSKNINAIAGYSNIKYIAGNLRRYVGNATYDLPVGDTAYYELANIQVVNNTDLNYIDVFFTRNNSQVVPGGLKVQNTPITSFLNYGYWNINSNTECSSVNYNLSVQSNGHSNGGGTTDMYCVITDTTTAGNSWQDIGVHSNSTQIIQGSYIIAKRSVYTRFGKYIIAKADGSIYNQPLITNELINKGAVVRINGKTLNLQGANGIDYNTSNAFTKINSSGTFNIDVDLNNNSGTNFISQGTILIKGNTTNNGSKLIQYSGTINCNNNIVNSGNATLTVLGIVNVNGNLTNLDNSSIQLDGTINLTGSWLNNGTPSIIRSGGNIGTVNFNGINYQTISGSSVTEFANLTLNNLNHLYLYQNIIVDSLLTFTNGKLKTNANMVIVKSTRTDVINNYNASRYIHGNLRRYVTNATYELPVGDTLYYELAKIQIYANTGLSYIDVHFTKDANSTPPAGLKVQGTPILSFLNYGYWTIIPNSGYTSAGYNLQIQSQGHTNGGGTADLYSLISDIGSGWTDYGVHSNSTQIINNPYISAVRTVMSQFGNYKIGKSSGEIYNQPPITNELNNKGANIRIFNTSVVNVQGINAEVDNSKLYGVIDIKPSASLNNSGNLYNSNSARIQVEGLLVNSGNIQNNSNAAIQIDGNINMYGTSWINNAISNTALGDLTKRGTVNFMSTTSLQTLSGTSKTYFENLNVNNSYGISLLKGQRVDSLLIFTKGKVYTNTDTIFITSVKTDAIRNYNSNYYIVGNLRRYVKNQTYDLPVGDSLRYELANIEIDNSNNLNYVDVKFVTKNIQDSATKLATPIFVSNTKINQFLNYGYWVINGNAGFTNLNCRINCQSQGHTNGGGYPENYALITDAGGGWQDIGVHSATTQIINSSYISAKRSVLNVLGRFIIGKSFNDIYNQAPLTNELMNKGAVIKILTGKTLNITGIAAEIDNTNSAVLQIVNTAIINNDGHVYNNNLAKIYNDGNLNLKGNWINNSRADISDGNANKGIVAFTGNAIQFIGGDSKTKFEKVTINNTNLGVRLSNNIYISDVLTMTDGDLDLGNDTIDLGFTGTLTGETKDNRIKALGAGNVEGMGKGTIIAGAIINGVTNLNVGGLGMMITTSGNLDTTYVVRGHKRDTINSTLYSINRHYNVTPKNQGILTTLNMNYFDIEWSTITGVEQYMVMYHNHGGTWSSMKSNNVNTTTNILSATTTTFSDFTGVIADPSISLPVELVDFIAKALDNKYVMLNWQTYSENNSDYFVVERSRNALDFEDLLTVNAAGKSNSIKRYTNYDENPYKGVSFYRLRQVDRDGKIKYTETRTVEILETLNERNLSVYPNPTNADLGLNLKFSGYNPEEQILIMILDLTGKVIM